MSLDIQKNELHYYIDLLRIQDSKPRSNEKCMLCVTALYNKSVNLSTLLY